MAFIATSIRGQAMVFSLMILSGIGLSVGMFVSLHRAEQNVIQAELASQAHDRAHVICMAMGSHSEHVSALQSFYAASQSVERDEFHAFVGELVDHPAMLGAFWVPLVSAADRIAFEAQVQADGVVGFHIQSETEPDRATAASAPAAYYPVCYAEPAVPMHFLLGRDLGGNARFRDAADRARDSGLVTAQSNMHLGMPDECDADIGVMLAIYRNGSIPTTIEQRREHLLGFVLTVVNTETLVEEALARLTPAGLDVALYLGDEPTADHLLYDHASRKAADGESRDSARLPSIREVHRFRLDNITFTVASRATPAFFSGRTHLDSWLALLCGLSMTVFAASVVRQSWRRRVVIEQQVIARTTELATTNEMLRKEIAERRMGEGQLRKLNQAVEQSPASIVITDTAGRIEYVNPKFTQVTGYTSEEAIGQNPRILKSGRTSAEEYRELWRTITSGKEWRGQFENKSKSGQIYWEQASVSPMRDTSGEITHYLAVKEDITKQKQIDEALRHSEERYRSLFESSSDAIMLASGSGFIDCNRATLAMFGCVDVDEFRTLHPADLSPPQQPGGLDSRTAARQKMAEVFASGSDRFEWVHRRRNGEEFLAEVMLTAFELHGQPVLQATVRDLTARIKAEEAERDRKNLQSAIHAMEDVLGIVGHELRTPLAGIRAMSEVLLDDKEMQLPEFPEFLGAIHSEIIRMAELVNNLLEAARLNSGNAQWSWEQVDFTATIKAVETVVRPLINQDRVTLRFDIAGAPCRMRGDQGAIERLLINLVSNAVKHTPDGVIDVRIFEQTRDGNKWAQIDVNDSGDGIPENILDKLGKAFVLNSGVIGSDYVKGAGLGLAICKGIAGAHGGEIRVRSAAKQGATFTALLRTDLPGPATFDTEGSLTLETQP